MDGRQVPLGYGVRDRKLVVSETEAAQVRHIYGRYIQLANVDSLRRELAKDGYRGKGRYKDGKQTTSISSNGALTHILTNPLYRGWISHRGELHAGQHEAIVSKELWDEVQAVISTRKRENTSVPRARGRNPLLGLLSNDKQQTFYASYTKKRGHLPYRYYVTKKNGDAKQLRLPAAEMEMHVDAAITAYLKDKQRLISHFSLQKESESTQVLSFAATFVALTESERWTMWRTLIESVKYAQSQLCIKIDENELARVFDLSPAADRPIYIEYPICLHRVGNDIRLVIPAEQGQPQAAKFDAPLVRYVARGRQWYKLLTGGEQSLTAIARAERVTVTYVARVIRGSLLAPDIVQRILEGRQPVGLTVQALSVPIPVDWTVQRRHFGV